MTSIVSLIFDVVLAGLLIATIAYAIILNRGLTQLHQSRGEMEGLIRNFSEATARAEAGIKAMKRTASESGEALQRNIERAQGLRDELQFMIEAGDSLAHRLAETSQSGSSRSGAAKGGAPVNVRPMNDRLASDRHSSNDRQSSSDRLANDRLGSDRLGSERLGTGVSPGRAAVAGPSAGPPLRRSTAAAEVGLAGLDNGGEPGGGRSFPVRSESPRRGTGTGAGREAAERYAAPEEPRPMRREGGDGMSRAERELLEAMENRR